MGQKAGPTRTVVVAGGNEGAASFEDCWVQLRTILPNFLVTKSQLPYQQLSEALSNFLDLSRPLSSELVSSCVHLVVQATHCTPLLLEVWSMV